MCMPWANTWPMPSMSWREPEAMTCRKPLLQLAWLLSGPTLSPRWTAYEAKRYELTLPEEIPTSTRERAYGSPIWIRPQ